MVAIGTIWAFFRRLSVFLSRHKLLVFMIVLAMFLSISIKPGFRVQPDTHAASLVHQLLTQATSADRNLHARPGGERAEQDYLGVINLYKMALDADSERRAGDQALLSMARLAEEFAAHKPRYYYNAVEHYQQLIDSYPGSPHHALALVKQAQILEKHLDDAEAAARAYQAVVARFPNSVSAREAAANLDRLHAAGEHTEASEQLASEERLITSIRNFSGPDYARIVIDVGSPVTVDKSQQSNGMVSLFMREAKLNSQLADRNLAIDTNGLLKKVTAEAKEEGVRVNFECNELRDYAIFSLNDPHRVIIDLRGKMVAPVDVPAAATTPLDEMRPQVSGNLSLLRVLGLKVKRVVIDAGHGGHDTGALRAGMKEKEITLDIALKLRALLKQHIKDLDVVMTRDRDRFVALEERTAIANAQAADLFISIHINSSPNPESSGVETYYLSINANKDELEVAARENASTASNAHNLQTLLQRIVLDDKVIESRNFAQLVQRSLVNGLSDFSKGAAQNRGVKKAPFIVLIGANMPSVLAEVSFISNAEQAAALKTAEYRQKIAQSLYEGIRRYIDALSKGSQSAAAAN